MRDYARIARSPRREAPDARRYLGRSYRSRRGPERASVLGNERNGGDKVNVSYGACYERANECRDSRRRFVSARARIYGTAAETRVIIADLYEDRTR